MVASAGCSSRPTAPPAKAPVRGAWVDARFRPHEARQQRRDVQQRGHRRRRAAQGSAATAAVIEALACERLAGRAAPGRVGSDGTAAARPLLRCDGAARLLASSVLVRLLKTISVWETTVISCTRRRVESGSGPSVAGSVYSLITHAEPIVTLRRRTRGDPIISPAVRVPCSASRPAGPAPPPGACYCDVRARPRRSGGCNGRSRAPAAASCP